MHDATRPLADPHAVVVTLELAASEEAELQEYETITAQSMVNADD